jgi:hypothetical protein
MHGSQVIRLWFLPQQHLSRQRNGSKRVMNSKIGNFARRNSKRALVIALPRVSPDGKPTSSGMALLKSLKKGPLFPTEVASKTGQPLFRVRSGLRELKNAGFVGQAEDKYGLSTSGEALVP